MGEDLGVTLSRVRPRRLAAATCVVALAIPSLALADDESIDDLAADPAPHLGDLPDVNYLWDGGALPFIWGAIAGRLVLELYYKGRGT